jgi:hypothetical protein
VAAKRVISIPKEQNSETIEAAPYEAGIFYRGGPNATMFGGIGPRVLIDPVQFTPKAGASVPIVFRIGMNFQGDTYPFVRSLSSRFTLADRLGERAIKTLDGDDPAAEIKFASSGLAVIVHERAPEQVVFANFEKFQESLTFEGLEPMIEIHRSAGKPLAQIRELYSRCAKSLISVGNGAGADKLIGMPLELVAEKNPYLLAGATDLPVRLYAQGKPISSVLVKSFNRDDPKSPRLMRTDAEGRAIIDVTLPGEYLISAVQMLEPKPGDDADWVSYWASLTFAKR